MGLNLGERKCLKCRKYEFTDDDLEFASVVAKAETNRGSFAIPLTCENCGAEMALVVYDRYGTGRTEGLGTAVAFNHTINDEPCYDETCGMCYGDEAKSSPGDAGEKSGEATE